MAEDSSRQIATIEITLLHFRKQLLPRAQALKARLEQGHSIDDYDLEFLDHLLKQIQNLHAVTYDHPQYQSFVAKVIQSYADLVQLASENPNE